MMLEFFFFLNEQPFTKVESRNSIQLVHGKQIQRLNRFVTGTIHTEHTIKIYKALT